MTNFLDWLMGGSAPSDTSAQNAQGIVPQQPNPNAPADSSSVSARSPAAQSPA